MGRIYALPRRIASRTGAAPQAIRK